MANISSFSSTMLGLRLPFGKYRVRVSKPGYQTVEEWVDLTPYDNHYGQRHIHMPEG